VASAAAFDATKPIPLSSRAFAEHKSDWYRRLLEEGSVYRGPIAFLKLFLVVHYEDCKAVLKDPRLFRDRGRATGKGGGPMPFPLPKSIAALASSMIVQDDPAHRRLRNLVNKAFTPGAIVRLENRVESLCHELLDEAEKLGSVDLMTAYSRPVPTRVIAEMVGVPNRDVRRLNDSLRVLSRGFSGWNVLRTLVWDLRKTAAFMRQLIEDKRREPGDDILSELIQAEEEGDRLDDQELVSMLFLLIVAGFETTLHLITNAVHTLLTHPEQLARLRADPELMESAVEEIIRHRGPIHGTKAQYASEDLTLHGVAVPRGSAIMPLLGAANHDPTVFDNPGVFDVARSPNRHLGFGFGMHFCLGAQLARMETRVALRCLLERSPDLRLAIAPGELRIVNAPGWHRYASLPVALA
jgi:cytochrome P450